MHCHQSQKVFSFVSLPGMNQKKRPRRKFHEVERLYQCNYPSCSKAYGTLNHLNAHVSMQRHGPKRQPSEFKELRKMWRKQKRDSKQRSNSLESFQDTAPPPMDSDGPNDLLNQPHYMPPPPCTSASFMPSQQSQQSESNFHAPHWINQRSVYPAASTHFMPLGY
ncbi:hypothetical protein BD560DRAFT_327632 [Blakeslea trispora]|nr:hypothetical protein BD560DRAFT_327632 [Blakeslea trispora]